MKIKPLDIEDEAFCALAEKTGTVFSSAIFLRAMRPKVKVYGIFSKADQLLAGFAVYENSLRKLRTLSAPPFSPHIGLFVDCDKKSVAAKNKLKKDLARALAGFFKKAKQPVVFLSLPPDWEDMQPFLWAGFDVAPRYTYRVDLKLSEDELLANMDRGTRSLIRQAYKSGLRMDAWDDYSAARKMISNTFSKKRIGIDEVALKHLVEAKGLGRCSYLMAAWEGEDASSVAFCLYDSKTAYYVAGGGDTRHRHPASGTVVVWEAIKYAKAQGLEVFDFEGSMVPGIESFFRGFGGELVSYNGLFRARFLARWWLKLTGFSF